MRLGAVFVLLALVVAVCARAELIENKIAGSVNFTYTFTGGLSFCSQCGTAGQYACSPDGTGTTLGNWNSGTISFQDPTPVGSVPHTLRIAIAGAWSCDPTKSSAMFGLSVNGVTFAVRDITGGQTVNPCKCDTCDTADGTTFTFRNGIPGYVKGGVNRVQLVMYRNNICINKATIYIDYETTNTELPHIYSVVKDFKPLTNVSCPICNSGLIGESLYCTDAGTTFSFQVQDPVPRGALLIGVDVHLSYNVRSRAYNSVYTTLAFSLTNQAIATERCVDNSFRQQCGCLANSVVQSAFYQRGWPNYVYGAKNAISMVATRYVVGYGDVCIGRIGVDFIYYYPGETDPAILRRYFDPSGQELA